MAEFKLDENKIDALIDRGEGLIKKIERLIGQLDKKNSPFERCFAFYELADFCLAIKFALQIRQEARAFGHALHHSFFDCEDKEKGAWDKAEPALLTVMKDCDEARGDNESAIVSIMRGSEKEDGLEGFSKDEMKKIKELLDKIMG